MCLGDEETVDHLLLHCTIAQGLWSAVLSWFDCAWAHPDSILGQFEAWHMEIGSEKGKALWRSSFRAVLWSIWNERNAQCFDDNQSSLESLVDRLKFTIAPWVSILPRFRDIPFDFIVRNWRELALPYMGADL